MVHVLLLSTAMVAREEAVVARRLADLEGSAEICYNLEIPTWWPCLLP
jgi:hypothetical protein